MSDCIFCKIANGEIPTTTVYENDLVRAFVDTDPHGANPLCLWCRSVTFRA